MHKSNSDCVCAHTRKKHCVKCGESFRHEKEVNKENLNLMRLLVSKGCVTEDMGDCLKSMNNQSQPQSVP